MSFADIDDYSNVTVTTSQAEVPHAPPKHHLSEQSAAGEVDVTTVGEEVMAESRRSHDVQKRTVELEAAFYEDYGRELDASSRAAFVCFMQYKPMARLPLLGAEPSGMLVATWVSGPECLSIRFSDRYHVDFAVTYEGTDGLARQWGQSLLGDVFTDCPEAKRLAAT